MKLLVNLEKQQKQKLFKRLKNFLLDLKSYPQKKTIYTS